MGLMDSKVVILDLDGTVWDSWPWYAQLLRVEPEGLATELRAGKPIASMLRQAGRRTDFRRLARTHSDDLALYGAVGEVLGEVVARGVRTAVVTNLPRWMAEPMLAAKRLAERFDLVLPWSTNERSKAVRIRRAVAELGSRGWYVGDVAADRSAAHEAQARFAWASWGYGDEPPRVDRVLSDFTDLVTL